METENTIWCERYRPTTMDEFVGNKHIKDKINLEVDFISKSAKEKIEKNGSSIKLTTK